MIVILFGVSGSGKSVVGTEFSKQMDFLFYDADDFHSESNKAKMHAGSPLTDKDRLPWLQTLSELILKHVEMEEPMVLACSALKESYRTTLNVSPACHFVYLKGSFELIKKRLENRKGHFFNPQLLKSQFDSLEEPSDCLVIDIEDTPLNIVKKLRDGLRL